MLGNNFAEEIIEFYTDKDYDLNHNVVFNNICVKYHVNPPKKIKIEECPDNLWYTAGSVYYLKWVNNNYIIRCCILANEVSISIDDHKHPSITIYKDLKMAFRFLYEQLTIHY